MNPSLATPAPPAAPVAVLQATAIAGADEPAGMFDLILRGQTRLSALLRDPSRHGVLIQQLLVLSILGLAVHGVVLGAVTQLLRVPGQSGVPVIWMPLAFTGAFIGTLGICLPSFYFYTQLSGLDASFRLVTAQALRAQATTSLLLLGVLPFFAASALACSLHLFGDPGAIFHLGMCLPFGVGLFGVHALYRGFADLAQTLPVTHRRRGNFLRRMVLCWGALYTVVAPVALVRLSSALAAFTSHS